MRNTVKDEGLNLEFGKQSQVVKLFAAELQQLFFHRAKGSSWHIANTGGEGNDGETNRQLKRRYEDRDKAFGTEAVDL